MKEDYAINENRICVMGFSSDGFGVYGVLIAYPETFAAAVSVAGGWHAAYGKKSFWGWLFKQRR